MYRSSIGRAKHSRLDDREHNETMGHCTPMDTSSSPNKQIRITTGGVDSDFRTRPLSMSQEQSEPFTSSSAVAALANRSGKAGSIMATLLCPQRWSNRNAVLQQASVHSHHGHASPEMFNVSSPCSSVVSSLSLSSPDAVVAKNGPTQFPHFLTHTPHESSLYHSSVGSSVSALPSKLSQTSSDACGFEKLTSSRVIQAVSGKPSSTCTSTVESLKIDQKKGSYNKNILVPEFKETSKEFKGTKLAMSAFEEDAPTTSKHNNDNNMCVRQEKAKAPAPREGGSNTGVVGTKKRKKDMVTKEQIVELFHLRIKDAAELLNMSTTSFKKVCRENDIVRWPFKKKAFCERIQNQWQATKKSQEKPKAKTSSSNDKAATTNDACDSPAAATCAPSVASPSSSTRTLSSDGDMLFFDVEGFYGSQDFETKMRQIIEDFRKHIKESETTNVNPNRVAAYLNSQQQYLVTEDLLNLQLYLAQQRNNNNNDTTLNPANCNFFRN